MKQPSLYGPIAGPLGEREGWITNGKEEARKGEKVRSEKEEAREREKEEQE